MAVVWSKRVGDNLHEVRTAGKSVRLYTNGVFHSQWNPNRLLTRSVWDSLMLSAFFMEPDQLRRVLVLGVGGGVVIKQLVKLFPDIEVVGVELDQVHISVARKWFNVSQTDAELIQADATVWLRDYEGPKFDLIIEDLFGDTDGEVSRSVCVDDQWSDLLCQHLNDSGVLTVNFIGKSELKKSGLFSSEQFATRHCFTPPYCDNAVAVFVANDTTLKQWKQRIKSQDAFSPAQSRSILSDKRMAF